MREPLLVSRVLISLLFPGVSFFAGDDQGFVPLKDTPEALREVSSIVGSSSGRLFFGERI